MTPFGPRIALISFIGLAIGVCTSPVSADWLVMQDGARLETRGDWSVDGRLVVFTQPNGTLSALRLREVDLAASEALTRSEELGSEASQRAEPEEPPQPRWTWTNKDIPKVGVQGSFDVQPIVGPQGLELLDIREEPDATGRNLVVRGTLVNRAGRFASGLEVIVALLTDEGGTLDETRARIDTTELPPGAATRFVASFLDTDPGAGEIQVRVETRESEELASLDAGGPPRFGR